MDPSTFALLTAPRRVRLCIPSTNSELGRTITLTSASIESVEQASAALRRESCAKAAALRAGDGSSSDDDLSDDEDLNADDSAATLSLHTLPVAASIGGKLWDASILFGCWLMAKAKAELAPPSERPLRILELGAGLGVAGLCAAIALVCMRGPHARAHPPPPPPPRIVAQVARPDCRPPSAAPFFFHVHSQPASRITLTDYDTAVTANLASAIASLPPSSAAADIATLDFRDFEPSAPRSGDKPTPPTAALPAQYSDMLASIDLIIAADVVYEQSHCALAQVVCALLAPAPAHATWEPRAIFVLPDSRPRLRAFCDSLRDAGLECEIQACTPSPAMAKSLRRSHEGWGSGGATFSLYTVTRRPLVSV